MIIVEKRLILGLLFLFFFINVEPVMAASNAQWQIIWKDNDNIHEKVSVDKKIAKFASTEWNYSETGEKIIIQREIKGWDVYQNLEDKLPLEVSITDFLLFKNITIKTTTFENNPEKVSEAVLGLNNVDLIINVPGIIRDSSADEIKDVTAKWHLEKLTDLGEQKTILQVTTFDGFLLGLSILILGILIITIVFISRIRKTHKLIEDEYSIKNLTLPNPDESDNEKDI